MSGGLIQFANNASSKLAAPITDIATSMTMLSGEGARFPQPSGGTYFYATLIDVNNNIEVVRVTARSNDVMTIVRAQDGTTGRAFAAQSYVGLLIPKAALNAFLQDNGGAVNGAYTFNGSVSFTAAVGFSGSGSFTFPSGTGNAGEGVAQWNTGNDLLTVGTGAVIKTMVDTNSTQTLSGKTLTTPTLTTPVIAALGSRMSTQDGVTTGNSGIAAAASSLGEMEVRGNGTGAAMMCFHRPGAYAAYLGLDTDNKWKVGGWSAGAAAYALYHEGNPPPAGTPVIPSGSRTIFAQAAAPTGWTKLTATGNDYILRVITGGTGGIITGSVLASTVFGRAGTDGHTLTLSEIPAHAHWDVWAGSGPFGQDPTQATSGATYTAQSRNLAATALAGGGAAHSHNMDMRVFMMDVILCEKN